ncbi:hypothetical protein ACSQ6I_23430 [Anabaena sp. WFMT]|uniref:hypothetical protein n=1 Tax=Anabaena sp. WFMT TaxID=3449730 RepID=UPI003F25852E
MLKKLGVAIAIVLNLSAVTQAAEQYLKVGTDNVGVPFMLDTWTMGEKDESFGKVLKIYQLKSDLMFEYMLDPGCGDERLWIVGTRVYNSKGVKVGEEKNNSEIPARGNSFGSTAMKYYCRSIGARGW